MKILLRAIATIYNRIRTIISDTCGEFDLSSKEHRTNCNSIELYRVNKTMEKTCDTIENDYTSSYCEIKHGKTLYRVTGIFTGETDLKEALEDLAVKRALHKIRNDLI